MDKQTEKYIKEMRAFARKLSKDPEAARRFRDKTGIYTKNGNLKKQYK